MESYAPYHLEDKEVGTSAAMENGLKPRREKMCGCSLIEWIPLQLGREDVLTQGPCDDLNS